MIGKKKPFHIGFGQDKQRQEKGPKKRHNKAQGTHLSTHSGFP